VPERLQTALVRKKAGSIGIPIGGVEFKLVDDHGQTITASNAPGEICIKGHNVMKRTARSTLPRTSTRASSSSGTRCPRDRRGRY
jgi:acyl-CoA synthetase (AMP-forming)/AMP-acid ligase II